MSQRGQKHEDFETFLCNLETTRNNSKLKHARAICKLKTVFRNNDLIFQHNSNSYRDSSLTGLLDELPGKGWRCLWMLIRVTCIPIDLIVPRLIDGNCWSIVRWEDNIISLSYSIAGPTAEVVNIFIPILSNLSAWRNMKHPKKQVSLSTVFSSNGFLVFFHDRTDMPYCFCYLLALPLKRVDARLTEGRHIYASLGQVNITLLERDPPIIRKHDFKLIL